MGVALAEEARRRGADVTLLAANLAVAAPARHRVVQTPTAAAMRDAALALAGRRRRDGRRGRRLPPGRADRRQAAEGRAAWSVELEPTVDILRGLGERKRTGRCSSASPPTRRGGARAQAREARAKSADLIVFNDVGARRHRLRRRRQRGRAHLARGERAVPRRAKEAIAAAVLDAVEGFLA